MSAEELNQEDLDSLLQGAGEAESSSTLDQSEVETLLAGGPRAPDAPGAERGAQPMQLDELHELGPEAGVGAPGGGAGAPGLGAEHTFDLLSDVSLNVRIELGRRRMHVEDILRLGEGSVVELDKLAGDPVDILVNEILVAKGEVLVLNDYFCVRVTDILSPKEAFRKAGGKTAPEPGRSA